MKLSELQIDVTVPVVETFHSLQGEAFHTGKSAFSFGWVGGWMPMLRHQTFLAR